MNHGWIGCTRMADPTCRPARSDGVGTIAKGPDFWRGNAVRSSNGRLGEASPPGRRASVPLVGAHRRGAPLFPMPTGEGNPRSRSRKKALPIDISNLLTSFLMSGRPAPVVEGASARSARIRGRISAHVENPVPPPPSLRLHLSFQERLLQAS